LDLAKHPARICCHFSCRTDLPSVRASCRERIANPSYKKCLTTLTACLGPLGKRGRRRGTGMAAAEPRPGPFSLGCATAVSTVGDHSARLTPSPHTETSHLWATLVAGRSKRTLVCSPARTVTSRVSAIGPLPRLISAFSV